MTSFLANTRKAIGTAIVGVYAWAQYVVSSNSDKITAEEWLLLGGVGVAVAAVYGLTNTPSEPSV
jgi:imidazoleglycerol phosphate synthase glutamine amidotransferase subunit HisH